MKKSLIIILLLTLLMGLLYDAYRNPATLEMGEMIVVSNGLGRLGIGKNGGLYELSYRGGPNLASGGTHVNRGGYWNFAHWNWYSKSNAWNIHFDMSGTPEGTAVLSFGIAAARGQNSLTGRGTNREVADLRIWVNDQEAGGFTVASTGGVSYRSARQATRYEVKEIRFDASLLRDGQNVISLRHALSNPYTQGEEKGEHGSGPGCIIYDAIRLEIAR